MKSALLLWGASLSVPLVVATCLLLLPWGAPSREKSAYKHNGVVNYTNWHCSNCVINNVPVARWLDIFVTFPPYMQSQLNNRFHQEKQAIEICLQALYKNDSDTAARTWNTYLAEVNQDTLRQDAPTIYDRYICCKNAITGQASLQGAFLRECSRIDPEWHYLGGYDHTAFFKKVFADPRAKQAWWTMKDYALTNYKQWEALSKEKQWINTAVQRARLIKQSR